MRRDTGRRSQGEIAGPAAEVEDPLAILQGELLDAPAPPTEMQPEAEECVGEIVPAGDAVEMSTDESPLLGTADEPPLSETLTSL